MFGKSILLTFLLYLLSLVSCDTTTQPSGNNMLLKGTVEGLRKGTLYLQKVQDSLLVSIDSMVVDGSPEFQFVTDVESPEIYYLYLNKEGGDSLNDRILFFGEKGEITINTLLKTFESSAKVIGSENQELLQEYRKLVRQFDEKNLEYIKAYLEAAKVADKSKVLDSIQKAMDNLVKRRYLYALNFASTHGDNVIAPFIALTEVYDANIVFLDTVASKLTDQVKASKYGKEFLKFIAERKAEKLGE
ncbi:DUF4369 domain-containing protein [Flavobacteriaceae bacterium]|jgi:hypothetical protein|nr:DUF4369 domain-containing protein [Flavobacteriaceae bacterium]